MQEIFLRALDGGGIHWGMERTPIPIRLDDETIGRLDKAAASMGTNRAALMRFLLETFLGNFEGGGGVASLPINWKALMDGLDGRRAAVQKHSGQGDNIFTGGSVRAKYRVPQKAAVKKKKG
jgi:hypothetical protein